MGRRTIKYVLPLLLAATLLPACGTRRKAHEVYRRQLAASLQLPRQVDYLPEYKDVKTPRRDTIRVTDLDGREMILMKAVRDEESGEMVAAEMLDAAMVTARFRNIAERNGKIDLEFQVLVPPEMQDSRWQLRLHPDMFVLEDSLRLDDVVVTGAEYRKAQLRGYQQYERFLSRIVTDTLAFVDLRNLEIFVERNIPQVYALKTDTTFVSDEVFESYFGVSEQEAMEHYTNKFLRWRNEWRKANRQKMFNKYIKVPIVTEGIRLDTVIRFDNGAFLYNYVQTINTRPRLRKVDVVLSGDIFEQDKRLYEIPETEPLTYYISSLSAFVDGTPRYKKQITSRRVQANTACYIDFEQGSAEIDEDMSNNHFEIGRIKQNLASLIENKVFDLDSIIVTASCSPEGSVPFNTKLSQRRSESVSRYFEEYIRAYRDSLREENMVHVYFDGMAEEDIPGQTGNDVVFLSRNNPENWRMLDVLIAQSDSLTADQKREYIDICEIRDLDAREEMLSRKPYYRFLREVLYPRLRTVKFDFHLHRKGMVKDTIQTTVLDEEYMAGVQAIRDRDYEKAIQILRPYKDYNAAVAFCAMDYNASALAILETLPETDQVHYMLAVIYSRQGRDRDAVEHYLKACKLTPSYWHRGNLDPEIAALIKRYNLNRE